MNLNIRDRVLYEIGKGKTYDSAMANLIVKISEIDTTYKIVMPQRNDSLEISLSLNKSTGNSKINLNVSGSNFDDMLDEIAKEYEFSNLDLFDQKVEIKAQYQLNADLEEKLTPVKRSVPAGPITPSAQTRLYL